MSTTPYEDPNIEQSGVSSSLSVATHQLLAVISLHGSPTVYEVIASSEKSIVGAVVSVGGITGLKRLPYETLNM